MGQFEAVIYYSKNVLNGPSRCAGKVFAVIECYYTRMGDVLVAIKPTLVIHKKLT